MVTDFFSFSVWDYFLSRANAKKVLFGIFIRELLIKFDLHGVVGGIFSTIMLSRFFFSWPGHLVLVLSPAWSSLAVASLASILVVH